MKAPSIGMETAIQTLITIGGDTDTNASIAGQIIGTLVGIEHIPVSLKTKLQELRDYNWIKQVVANTIKIKQWH